MPHSTQSQNADCVKRGFSYLRFLCFTQFLGPDERMRTAWSMLWLREAWHGDCVERTKLREPRTEGHARAQETALSYSLPYPFRPLRPFCGS